MSSVEPNSDTAFLQLSMNFFDDKKCPFCNQKAHLMHLIQGLNLDEHNHDPNLCMNNWVALIAITDNKTNNMTPQKLQEYTDEMVLKIMDEVRNAQKGEFAE